MMEVVRCSWNAFVNMRSNVFVDYGQVVVYLDNIIKFLLTGMIEVVLDFQGRYFVVHEIEGATDIAAVVLLRFINSSVRLEIVQLVVNGTEQLNKWIGASFL